MKKIFNKVKNLFVVPMLLLGIVTVILIDAFKGELLNE